MMHDTRGDMLPMVAGIGFLLTLVFTLGFQFVRACVVTGCVKNAMRNDAIIAVTQNNFNAYASLREGLDGAYSIDAAGQVSENDTNTLKQDLVSSLGLHDSGDKLTKTVEDGPAYSLSGFGVQVSNPDFRATGTYKITVTGNLSIAMPLQWAPIIIPISAYADFRPKF